MIGDRPAGRATALVFAAVAGLAALGAAAQDQTAPAIPTEAPTIIPCGTFYEVTRGDTLREIAIDAYGVGNFQAIFDANRDILATPQLLLVGQTLFIPCLDGSGPQTREEAEALEARGRRQELRPPVVLEADLTLPEPVPQPTEAELFGEAVAAEDDNPAEDPALADAAPEATESPDATLAEAAETTDSPDESPDESAETGDGPAPQVLARLVPDTPNAGADLPETPSLSPALPTVAAPQPPEDAPAEALPAEAPVEARVAAPAAGADAPRPPRVAVPAVPAPSADPAAEGSASVLARLQPAVPAPRATAEVSVAEPETRAGAQALQPGLAASAPATPSPAVPTGPEAEPQTAPESPVRNGASSVQALQPGVPTPDAGAAPANGSDQIAALQTDAGATVGTADAPAVLGLQPAPGPAVGPAVGPAPGPDAADAAAPSPSAAPAEAAVQPPAPGVAVLSPAAQPAPGGVPQSAPAATAALQPAPGATAGLQLAPGATTAAQPAPGAAPGLQPAPGATSAVQPAPGGAPPLQPAPGATAAAQPAPGATAAAQPAPGAAAGLQPAPGATAGLQPAPGATSAVQPAPGAAAGLQPAPGGTAARQPAPNAAPGLQPAPGATAALQPAVQPGQTRLSPTPGPETFGAAVALRTTPEPGGPGQPPLGSAAPAAEAEQVEDAPSPVRPARIARPAQSIVTGAAGDAPTADPLGRLLAEGEPVTAEPEDAGRTQTASLAAPSGAATLPATAPRPAAQPAPGRPLAAPVGASGSGLFLPGATREPASAPTSGAAPGGGIRLLSGHFAPYAAPDLPQQGMLSEVVVRALAIAAPGRPAEIAFVNDWQAHLDILLPQGAFDLGFPWFRPDCGSARLGAALRELCNRYLWSEPLHELVVGYFMRAGNPLVAAADPEALRGLTLCRPAAGGVFDLEQRGLGPDAVRLVRPQSAEDCFRALMAGEVDVVTFEVAALERAVAVSGLVGQVREAVDLADLLTLHALAPRANPLARPYITLLNRGLRDMRESGEWFTLVARHLAALQARAN